MDVKPGALRALRKVTAARILTAWMEAAEMFPVASWTDKEQRRVFTGGLLSTYSAAHANSLAKIKVHPITCHKSPQ
jgi:hypothetical protein